MGIPEASGFPSDYAAQLGEIVEQFRRGMNESALTLASQLADDTDDARTEAHALLAMLAALDNLDRTAEAPAIIDRTFEVLSTLEDPELLGNLHALAGGVAANSSLERGMRHFLHSSRNLDRVHTPTVEFWHAAHNLAVAFSYLGFHHQAMKTTERAYAAARQIGLPAYDHAIPEVTIRWALARDHRGDTEGCIELLREVLRTWSERGSPMNLWTIERHYYGYAALRLNTLGQYTRVDPDWFVSEPEQVGQWEACDLSLLSTACAALIDNKPQEALDQLADQTVNPYTVGAAEIHRLRALAYTALGDHASAVRANRAATRIAYHGIEELHDRFVDGVGAQLDREELNRTVGRYASEALTDPLTALPNRRHFDQHITIIGGTTATNCVGVVDLDNFKEINTVHGHLSGDLVLKRVAAVLGRTLRKGDFLARYGGDEFVLVLPDTTAESAAILGVRMTTAVADEQWEALVPGTPVSVTIGWAEFTTEDQLSLALKSADHKMLAQKQSLG